MFKWLNPVNWWLGLKGAIAFAGENPLGFGFTWLASGWQTVATFAFPVSFAYPNWARDLATEVWPVVSTLAGQVWATLREVVLALFNTS